MLGTFQQVTAIEPHPYSVMFGTGKGGVGKSTMASAYAQYCAQRGLRTLLICVTSQEDDDLGVSRFNKGIHPDGPSVLDGAGLHQALLMRKDLRPIREVRPNLDVVPGGRAVAEVLNILLLRTAQEGPSVAQALMHSLKNIMGNYDRIVIDSAPENDPLEQLALAAVRWLFIPTRTDHSSKKGLDRIAANYKIVRRQVNPHVKVGAAFVYCSNPTAYALHEEALEEVREVLGARTPTLPTIVGSREAPATWAREHGLTFAECAALAASGTPSTYKHQLLGKTKRPLPDSMTVLAQEMDQLNEAIDKTMHGVAA